MLTQESLATLMTGMMAQTGSLGQPLLIPLSMAGSIGGQGGLAVLTLPTTSVASLPGFAAANAAGNLFKLPFAGLQGKLFRRAPDLVSRFLQLYFGQVQLTPNISFHL